MTASALYEGFVAHRRHGPRPHAFRYRLFMMYLDLDELPALFEKRWLWSVERSNVASFRRSDYLGDPERPLKACVLERFAELTGRRPTGPVRVLTHVRTFGYAFNPVSFYYCFERDETLAGVVAEITNTPWGERHAYALAAGPAGVHERFQKAFHVSPFFDLDQTYEWSLSTPGETLDVGMVNVEGGSRVFDATLAMERRELSGANLARALVRYPAITAKVHAAIYWQALRLYLKRTPFFSHPSKREADPQCPSS